MEKMIFYLNCVQEMLQHYCPLNVHGSNNQCYQYKNTTNLTNKFTCKNHRIFCTHYLTRLFHQKFICKDSIPLYLHVLTSLMAVACCTTTVIHKMLSVFKKPLLR